MGSRALSWFKNHSQSSLILTISYTYFIHLLMYPQRPEVSTPASGSVAAASEDVSVCSTGNSPSLTRHVTWIEPLSAATTCAATQTEVEGDVTEAIDRRMKRVAKMLYMAMAYASTIGGVATLIGTPTNFILVEKLNQCVRFSLW